MLATSPLVPSLYKLFSLLLQASGTFG